MRISDWSSDVCSSDLHWLVVLEGADLIENDHEDTLLDLLFDGSATLPANTLIAVHFSKYCDLSEALSDEDVPITYLEMDPPAEGIALVNAASILPEIFRRAPIDQTSIPLAESQRSEERREGKGWVMTCG